MRRPVSVTMQEDNLLWLKAQAGGSVNGSVSAVLDRLVTEARLQGRTDAAAIRSVVGTIDLPAGDESLEHADAYVRAMLDRSLRRPLAVRERPAGPKSRKRRG